MTELSIVTPALDEEENLPALYRRLRSVGIGAAWEWIVVDDGSVDGTSRAVADLAAADRRVRGLRLERSSGSHPAILRGLAESRGAAVVLLAADLQDPPEAIAALVERWRAGADVVWAVRRGRPGEDVASRAFSRLYHALMRRLTGAAGLPPSGAGFCLFDRSIALSLAREVPAPVDVFVAASRRAARPAAVVYEPGRRERGRSRWTAAKKWRFALRALRQGLAQRGRQQPLG